MGKTATRREWTKDDVRMLRALTKEGAKRSVRGASGGESIEQCSVAVRNAGTKIDEVLPDIKVVGNSWISLIAYQAKGYGYIAP